MKKFPVISENGNEYEVEMYRGTFGIFFVEVYVRKDFIFGIKIKRNVNGYNETYSEEKWNYDYVAIAKHAVQKYEESVAEFIRRKQIESKRLAEFIEWDGDCR